MSGKKYILDEQLIDVYFQKSYKFIFPLLKIKTDQFRPVQTYLSWLDKINEKDYKLICEYDLHDSVTYKKFEKEVLFSNPYFDDFRTLEKNKAAYIFTLIKFKRDMDLFYKGSYSLLSTETKNIVLNYYNPNLNNKKYIDSYLNPETYFTKYSELLEVPVHIVKNSGELCNKYDRNKERLHLNEVILNFQM